MKAVKLIGLYLAPHFFAISLFLAFIAARCGFASSFALSYEIAPVCSQSLIVLISSVCFIISSFMVLFSYALDFKGRPCVFQGKTRFFIVFLRVFCKKCVKIINFYIFSFLGFFRFLNKDAVLSISGKCKRLKNRFDFWLGNGIEGAWNGQ